MQSNEVSGLPNGSALEGTPSSSVSTGGLPSKAGFFSHPEDVLSDTSLSIADKRAILASWASDSRAVKNAPTLRQLDNGAVIGIDDVLQAMTRLDETEAQPRTLRPWRISFVRRRGSPILPLPREPSWRRGRDDDDDPPPSAAAVAVPRPPMFVEARAVCA